MHPTIVSTVAAAALAVAPLAGPAAPGPDEPRPAWNAREHEAHRPAPAAGQSGRAVVASPCAAALSRAWDRLGHGSDAMETWLLTTDACRTPTPPSTPSASRWEASPM